MESNSDLEDEIGILPIRTWRTKLRFNSDLEEEITSDLEDEIGITQDEIENQFGPAGRNWTSTQFGPRGRN